MREKIKNIPGSPHGFGKFFKKIRNHRDTNPRPELFFVSSCSHSDLSDNLDMHDPSNLPSVPTVADNDIIKVVPPEFANDACGQDLPSSPIPPPPGSKSFL